MTTIVSAFIDIGRRSRPISTYLKYGRLLLELEIPKIIFLEQKTIEQYGISYLNMLPQTTIIPYNQNDLILNKLLHKNNVSNINLPNPPPSETKPSLKYLSIILNKTEWVKQAIELNTYNTSQFIWIDFGIYHTFNNPELYKKFVLNCQQKQYDKIRIASIWKLNQYIPSESQIKNNPLWFFAGGVFGGNKDKLLEFADKSKSKIEEITKDNYIMWEVNLWYLVFKDNKDLFDCYPSNHNPTILSNY